MRKRKAEYFFTVPLSNCARPFGMRCHIGSTDNVIGLIKRKSMPAVSILLKISTYDFLEIYSLNQSTR